MLRLVAQTQGLLRSHLHLCVRQSILRGRDHPWLELQAAMGQRGCGRGQLQHGEGVVPLTDAQRDGLAAVPLFLFRPLVIIALPFRAGQDAAHFAGQVDAGALAKTQRLHEIVDHIHPHVIGQRVVIHVARQHNRSHHVHRPKPGIAVAAESVAAIRPRACVVDDGTGTALARRQSSHGHEWLVGRAWRVGAAQCPVEQWLVDRLVEHLPIFDINAVYEQVGVEGGLAHEGEHLTIVGVQCHKGAAPVAEQIFHHFLELNVDGQDHVLARYGWAAGEAACGSPPGRSLHLVDPRDAMELALIALLNTQLANVFGAPVIGRQILILFQPLLVTLVDAPDVTNHVTCQLTVGILAEQSGLDFHTGESVTLRTEAGQLFVRQSIANGQRVKALGFLPQALETSTVLALDVHQIGQFVDRGLQIFHFGRCNLQCVS